MRKKFLLKFGVIVSVFAPFIAVVSCGNKTGNNSTENGDNSNNNGGNPNNDGDNPNNDGNYSPSEEDLKELSEVLKKIDFTGLTSDEFNKLSMNHQSFDIAAKEDLLIVVPSDVQGTVDLSPLTISVSKKANSDVLTYTYDDGGEKKLLDVQVKTFLPSEAASIMTLLKSSNETVRTQSKWSTAYTKSSGDYGQLLNSGGQISFIGVANRKAINEALAKVKNKAAVWVSKRGGKEGPSNTLTYTLVYSLDAEDTKKVVPHVDVEFTKFCPDELDNILFNLSHLYRTKLSKDDFTALTLDKDVNHSTTDDMDDDIGYNGDGLIVLYNKRGTIISDVPLTGDLGSGGSVHVKKEAGTTWVIWTIKYDSNSTSYDYAGEITEFDYDKQLN